MIPKLKFLHSVELLTATKLEVFRRLATATITTSLRLDQPGCLKVRPDGTVLDGHHRLMILQERGAEIDLLPREIIEKDS